LPLPLLDPVASVPLAWKSRLMPFQVEGVKALLTFRSLLLADDMGLGKTIQAIAAIRILHARSELRSALIVVPTSLIIQWRDELRTWAPELTVTVVRGAPSVRTEQWRSSGLIKLVGYETMRNDANSRVSHPIRMIQWGLVLLDEASRIKNAPTATARAAKRLNATRRWALTGTPLENSKQDVVSILSFLAGRPAKQHTVADDDLRTILKFVQLRRRKQDVLPELPAKRVIDLLIDLLPKQREAYLRAEREGVRRLREMGPDLPITCVLELIIRLKQICNRDPLSGQSAKIEDLRDRMSDLSAEGNRALIFSQFTDSDYGVRRLGIELEAFRPILYIGTMRLDDREESIRQFKSDSRHTAMILSLKVGGMGLNLQEASYVFHCDRWWNPAIEDQAESRAHRMGQSMPVTVYRYVARGTIEERIDEILAAKRSLFAQIVEGVSIDAVATNLTREDLLGLFGL
jgi:SNF2 family DNA or RNA helicase